MSACHTCTSEFSCGSLAVALKVVAALPDLDNRPQLRRVFHGIKSELDAKGWNYPDSAVLCGLAGQDPRIHALAAELIAELRRDRTLWERCGPKHDSAQATSLVEESHCD